MGGGRSGIATGGRMTWRTITRLKCFGNRMRSTGMPHDADPLPEAQIATLEAWIAQERSSQKILRKASSGG